MLLANQRSLSLQWICKKGRIHFWESQNQSNADIKSMMDKLMNPVAAVLSASIACSSFSLLRKCFGAVQFHSVEFISERAVEQHWDHQWGFQSCGSGLHSFSLFLWRRRRSKTHQMLIWYLHKQIQVKQVNPMPMEAEKSFGSLLHSEMKNWKKKMKSYCWKWFRSSYGKWWKCIWRRTKLQHFVFTKTLYRIGMEADLLLELCLLVWVPPHFRASSKLLHELHTCFEVCNRVIGEIWNFAVVMGKKLTEFPLDFQSRSGAGYKYAIDEKQRHRFTA